MMRGYLENDAANKEAFHFRKGDDGSETKWLRTGDVVKIDKRGYITITDRIKDVIKAKGFQVSPAELEGESSQVRFCDRINRIDLTILFKFTNGSGLVQRRQGR